jgi:orotidine-5'-phosphate decarboxylase
VQRSARAFPLRRSLETGRGAGSRGAGSTLLTQLKRELGERVFEPLRGIFASAQAAGALRSDLEPREFPTLLRMVGVTQRRTTRLTRADRSGSDTSHRSLTRCEPRRQRPCHHWTASRPQP